jgi:hypothetical protein
MKKLAITLLILAGALQLKAQQVPSLPKTAPYLIIKYPDTLFSLKRNVTPNQLQRELTAASMGNMPVAKMQGRSNMPMVQTDRTGYTMPVAGKNVSGVYYMKKKDSVVVAP